MFFELSEQSQSAEFDPLSRFFFLSVASNAKHHESADSKMNSCTPTGYITLNFFWSLGNSNTCISDGFNTKFLSQSHPLEKVNYFAFSFSFSFCTMQKSHILFILFFFFLLVDKKYSWHLTSVQLRNVQISHHNDYQRASLNTSCNLKFNRLVTIFLCFSDSLACHMNEFSNVNDAKISTNGISIEWRKIVERNASLSIFNFSCYVQIAWVPWSTVHKCSNPKEKMSKITGSSITWIILQSIRGLLMNDVSSVESRSLWC